MKLLIVESEEIIVVTIKKIIAQHFKEIEIIGVASTIKEALKCCYKVKPDILVMDVTIGTTISFELFEYIDPAEFAIIFISSYAEFALEALKYSAVAYLLKPIGLMTFLSSINKAIEKLRPPNLNLEQFKFDEWINEWNRESIEVSHNSRTKTILINAIVKIKSDRSYSTIHTSNKGALCISRNLHYFENILLNRGFLRIHRSTLVNSLHIQSYKVGRISTVLLTDFSSEVVSRRRIKELNNLNINSNYGS